MIAGKFMYEENWHARTCFFDMESNPIFREDHGHLRLRIGIRKG